MGDKLDIYPADQATISGLVEKGLIRKVGTDPFGNPVFENTELGNKIADELEMNKTNIRDLSSWKDPYRDYDIGDDFGDDFEDDDMDEGEIEIVDDDYEFDDQDDDYDNDFEWDEF